MRRGLIAAPLISNTQLFQRAALCDKFDYPFRLTTTTCPLHVSVLWVAIFCSNRSTFLFLFRDYLNKPRFPDGLS
jgi:hypothetical protein